MTPDQMIARAKKEGTFRKLSISNAWPPLRERLRKEEPALSDVYFIRCGAYVKIGIASDYGARFKSLQAQNPYPLQLIGLIETTGPCMLEHDIHMRWKHLHHRKEWFHLTPELRAWIQTNAPIPTGRIVK